MIYKRLSHLWDSLRNVDLLQGHECWPYASRTLTERARLADVTGREPKAWRNSGCVTAGVDTPVTGARVFATQSQHTHS